MLNLRKEMVSLGLVEYLIIAVAIFFLLKLMVESIRFLFYFFLMVLALVLLFGVSVTDLFRWGSEILLWVL